MHLAWEKPRDPFFKIKSSQMSGHSSDKPLHPPMHDGKAMSLGILMADAFGCPAIDGINDVGRAFNGTEAIPQAIPVSLQPVGQGGSRSGSL